MKMLPPILLAGLVALAAPALAEDQAFADPADQFNKALHHLLGSQGEEKSPERAVELFRDLAERDFAAAQHMLATLYEKGNGVDQDLAAAWYWYQRAANNGFASSRARLARIDRQLSDTQRQDATRQLVAQGDEVF